jgi:hypothetical protein
MCVLTRIHTARRCWLVAFTALTLSAAVAPSTALADREHDHPGAVFVRTNDISENAIRAGARDADGRLTLAGRSATLGQGGTEPGAPTIRRPRKVR